MTISYNWLKEYIDIPESPEEISEVLTSTGLEVESVELHETIRGGLAELIIGEVLTCSRHPNADKLTLTTVNIGGESPLHIVCGAPNVAQGQKVIVAPPGTTIYPTNGDPFTIKIAKIRGEQSEGMICAEDEIGLSDKHDGILVLPPETTVGTPASTYFNIQRDHILEIGLTPNRADAMSHIGVARDIRAVKNREVRWPSVSGFKVDSHDLEIPVEVKNAAACPRYSAVTISGVVVSDSPSWLKNRLLSIGLTPINNIVDVTNFVLHETGQPLHAFDADKITGGKVVVQTLPKGSRFVTLDEKERILTENDLMICDSVKGMCIAGVFGGINSGITETSTKIFLESACFSPDYIRRTGTHHGLKTDASFRFERGTDINVTVYALKRAAILIKEIAGGKISSEVIDFYPNKSGPRHIVVKDKNVNRLIGKELSRDEIFKILLLLEIEIVDKGESDYTVAVPSYRVDVLQEADVIEEILRIYGFNNVELREHASADYIAEFPIQDAGKFKTSIGQMLAGAGFYEIWTNSLTDFAYQEKHKLSFNGEPVEILNKLSEQQGILRQTMLFTGLEVCAYNINRRQKDLKLFEFGKVYAKVGGHYIEKEIVALYMTGNLEAESWQRKTVAVQYHDLAQHVQSIISKSEPGAITQQTLDDSLFEYSSSLHIKKHMIGKLGKVKSSLLKDLGIKQEIFYAELDTSLLFKGSSPKLVIKEVPKFPGVRRDLSLVIDKTITFAEIRETVLSIERRLIKDIFAFDVYEGKNIPENKKAYALGFTLQDENKTLTDEEIDGTMSRLMETFEKKLGAVIRK